MVIFIKLEPKHASKDEIELVVFEVLGEFRLGVRDLGLLLEYSVPSSGLWYLPSFTLSAKACTQAGRQSIQAHTNFPVELEENRGINVMRGFRVMDRSRHTRDGCGEFWARFELKVRMK
jgi:hypothetical protein